MGWRAKWLEGNSCIVVTATDGRGVYPEERPCGLDLKIGSFSEVACPAGYRLGLLFQRENRPGRIKTDFMAKLGWWEEVDERAAPEG